MEDFDAVPSTVSVLFVGDFFSLITTIEVDETDTLPDESDTDQAIRQAGEFLLRQYGWDVATAATQGAAVMGDDVD